MTTFAELTARVTAAAAAHGPPLNLVIEAPLSVAFNKNGNPTGRSIERIGSQTRYWYVGLGCAVLVATTYVLRRLLDSNPAREVRLFEGFVSFKRKGEKSDHLRDVELLRIAVSNAGRTGRIHGPKELTRVASDSIRSAFEVAGMDFGVPPVIGVG